MKSAVRLGAAVLLLAMQPTAAQPAWAASSQTATDEKAVANFYKGKTVHMIVGFPAGGGYDAYTRLIGRHLGKHIPGNPTVVVENMAGAGSIVAANHIYNVAPKDSTVIAHISGPIFREHSGDVVDQMDASMGLIVIKCR